MSSADKVTIIGMNVSRSERELNREALINLWKKNNNIPLKKVRVQKRSKRRK